MNTPAAIGVCTHNRGDAIGRTLQALGLQDAWATGRITTLVVVDNASTDGTADAVRRFAGAHGRLPIQLLHEQRPGKEYAMDRLLHGTDEPILLMVDDDVLPDPSWASALLRALDERPRAGMVGGRVVPEWQSGPAPIARRYERSLGLQDRGAQPSALSDPDAFLVGAAWALRREAWIESGWERDRVLGCRRGSVLQGGEDAELCLRLRAARWEAWYEPSARARHEIPAWRQTPAYLARLRESQGRVEPVLRWLAGSVRTEEDAMREHARARARLRKTRWTDWRFGRRTVRLGERRGRIEGWARVSKLIRSGVRPPG